MRTLLVTILASTFLFSCKGNKASNSKDANNESTEQIENATTSENSTPQANSGSAICILDKLSIRDTPGKKGKWLASMSIGEQITFTGEKVLDSVSKKDFSKVKLIDGKEGWTRSDFIVVGGKVGAMTEEAVVYKRPDLLTKTDKKYSPMDIIAVMTTQEDWIKVKGKRRTGKYVEESWIKSSNISESAVDIATAKYVTIALSKNDDTEKIKELREITNNSDLSGSKFIPLIEEQIKELQENNTLEVPENATKEEAEQE